MKIMSYFLEIGQNGQDINFTKFCCVFQKEPSSSSSIGATSNGSVASSVVAQSAPQAMAAPPMSTSTLSSPGDRLYEDIPEAGQWRHLVLFYGIDFEKYLKMS